MKTKITTATLDKWATQLINDEIERSDEQGAANVFVPFFPYSSLSNTQLFILQQFGYVGKIERNRSMIESVEITQKAYDAVLNKNDAFKKRVLSITKSIFQNVLIPLAVTLGTIYLTKK